MRTNTRSTMTFPKHRPWLPLLAVTALMAVAVVPTGGGGAAGATGAPKPARVSARPVAIRAATATINAHDGAFWAGGNQILFHGIGVGTPANTDLDKIAGWNMNFIRTHSEWAQLEPTPPVKNGSNWVHTYDQRYLNIIIDMVKAASARGLYVLINNGICQQEDNDNKPACSPVGWPHWLFTSQYNSHGRNYDLSTETDQGQALTDYWTDNLQQQFAGDMWTYLAGKLKTVPGVAMYEVMNEPHRGYYDSSHATTQLIFDVLVKLARDIRAADPNRTILFATRTGFLPGLPNLDLTGAASLGNIAFDLHNYFGARWGGGLAQGVNNFGETKQNQYNSTLSGLPYFGTTYGQIRFLQTYLNVLAPIGAPLLVGEFGDVNSDPGIMNYFGTTTQAFNLLKVSWNVHNNMYGRGAPDDWSVMDKNGNELPWLTQIIKPAAAFTG